MIHSQMIDLSLECIPLFPLPNVVLFPRAILPLHIFEDRYKVMTADALMGERQIAMALLRPGWERNYHSRPQIHPVVCVGTILSHEKLPDGNYNFLLQGHTRARILREHSGGAYRTAQLQPIVPSPILEIDLEDQRRRLIDLFQQGPWSRQPAAGQFLQLLRGPLTTPDIADLVAFNFLEDVPLKQSLLEEPDSRQRIDHIIHELNSLRPYATLLHQAAAHPGMN